MNLFRQWLFAAYFCGTCCGLAFGQVNGWPASLEMNLPEAIPRLARLPTITPPGMPGDGPFSGWHRADVKLAPDHVDDGDWGSGNDTKLPPWRLLPKSDSGWAFTGLTQIGVTANADNPANRFNGPQTFNDRNDVQLNQLYLSVQRSPEMGLQRLDWGTRIDLLFGTDYVFAQSLGLETQPNGDNGLNGLTAGGNPDVHGLAIPQAFVDLSYGRCNLRLGHFYTILGYEGVAPTSNFFYSHSYALQYGEPLTHTGGLLRWSGEQFTVQGGVVNGWDKTDGLNDDATFLGGVTFANSQSSLGISVISGPETGFVANRRRTMYSLVWQAAINDRLAYVLQHDLAYQRDALALHVDARWYGISQYLFYSLCDAWKLGLRYEWFRDSDGTRLSQMYARNGGLGLPAAGFAGTYHNVTLGANWTPTANFSLRPEIRCDWSQDTGLAPFADFSSDSQLTLAVDAVYVF